MKLPKRNKPVKRKRESFSRSAKNGKKSNIESIRILGSGETLGELSNSMKIDKDIFANTLDNPETEYYIKENAYLSEDAVDYVKETEGLGDMKPREIL